MNLDFLKTLVEIDSRTENYSGVELVQNIIAENLKSIGFDIKFISSDQDKTRKLLFAQKTGLLKEAISFVCHADTVAGPSAKCTFKLDLYANKAFGPGIGDNKGGVALLLGALKDFIEQNIHHQYTLNVICSPSEETGSIGFHSIFKMLGDESQLVLGMEPALSDGSIINQRSGNRWYKIKIFGLKAHAGRWNEASINAIHIASGLINDLAKINTNPSKRRINCTSIKSKNEKYNVICDEVELKFDARFEDFESLNYIDHSIRDYLENNIIHCPLSGKSSHYEIEIEDDCPPLSLDVKNLKLSNLYLEGLRTLESKKMLAKHSGGAADVNYFQNEKVISLDGLGPIGTGLHSLNESIDLESFYMRRNALVLLLENLEKVKKQESQEWNKYQLENQLPI